ncbi:MAG: DUF4238 domain-containing protein [Limisphaerales bacterium]
MPITKQQHYVPQFYLRNFCNSEGKLYVYDKQEDISYPTSPRNAGGERYFYDCEEMAAVSGDKQAVEQYLSALEGQMSPLIENLLRRLRANELCRLHPDTRFVISVFAAFQLIRTKETRITARQMSEQLIHFLEKHPGTEGQIREIRESMSEEKAKASHCRQLLDLPSILQCASIVERHIWVIMRRHPAGAFWASDEPITKREHVRQRFRSNSGIASPGIEIHIPLSHDYLIGCYERKHWRRMSTMDGKVVDLTSHENVIYYRQFQVRESLRFIYSNEPDFGFAQKMCREEPNWRDGQRKRITSNHDSEDDNRGA